MTPVKRYRPTGKSPAANHLECPAVESVTWAQALGQAALLCSLLFLVGLPVLRLGGMPWWSAVPLAPLATTCIVATAAVWWAWTPWDWNLVPVVVTACVVGYAVRVLHRRVYRVSEAQHPDPAHTRAQSPQPGMGQRVLVITAVAVICSIIVQAGPIVAGLGRPDALLQRWDHLFHLTAIRTIWDTGDASTLHLGRISVGSHSDRYYPAAWHDLVTLLPSHNVALVYNVGDVVLGTVPWVLGAAMLAHVVAPHLRTAPAIGALLSAVTTATPLVVGTGQAHQPNLLGFALLPAALAAVIRAIDDSPESAPPYRRILVVVLAVGATGFAHPNTAVTLLLLATPFALRSAVRLAQNAWSHRPLWMRAGLLIASTAPVLCVLAIRLTPRGQSISAFERSLDPATWGETLRMTVSVQSNLWPVVFNAWLGLLAIVGAILCLALRRPTPVLVLAIGAIIHIDALRSAGWGFSTLYYDDPVRTVVTLCVAALVPAVAGMAAAAEIIERLCGDNNLRRLSVGYIAYAVVIAVTVFALAGSVQYRAKRTALIADPKPGSVVMVSGLEQEKMAHMASIIGPDDAVLASPLSGAAYLYPLYGTKVVFPVHSTSRTPSQDLITQKVQLLERDPSVCRALKDWQVRYVYQDPLLYSEPDPAERSLNSVEIPGAMVVASAGRAQLLRLPECDDAGLPENLQEYP